VVSPARVGHKAGTCAVSGQGVWPGSIGCPGFLSRPIPDGRRLGPRLPSWGWSLSQRRDGDNDFLASVASVLRSLGTMLEGKISWRGLWMTVTPDPLCAQLWTMAINESVNVTRCVPAGARPCAERSTPRGAALWPWRMHSKRRPAPSARPSPPATAGTAGAGMVRGRSPGRQVREYSSKVRQRDTATPIPSAQQLGFPCGRGRSYLLKFGMARRASDPAGGEMRSARKSQ
jgi:hypothetical protein